MLACLALAGCSGTKPYDLHPWRSSDLICVNQSTGLHIGRDRESGRFTYWRIGGTFPDEGGLAPEGAKAMCPGLVK